MKLLMLRPHVRDVITEGLIKMIMLYYDNFAKVCS